MRLLPIKIVFEIMKKENNTNTSSLTLLTDANLKNLLYSFFCDDAIPLCNFEFKKNCSIVEKRLFLPKFSQFKFSNESVSCVKNGT